MVAATSSIALRPNEELHVTFLALVPKIETHARITFGYLKCANKKAAKVADAVALAWKWFVRLHERGKNATAFPFVFAALVARAVGSGRRIVGAEPSNDAMSTTAQRKHGFTMTLFPHSNAVSIQELQAILTPRNPSMPSKSAWPTTRRRRCRTKRHFGLISPNGCERSPCVRERWRRR